MVMSIAAIISRSLIMVDGDVNKSNTRCTDDSDSTDKALHVMLVREG